VSDELQRQIDVNRADIAKGKELVYPVVEQAKTNTAAIDRLEGQVEKVETRLEGKIERTDTQVQDLSLVVTEAIGAAKTLTGAFDGMSAQIATIRESEAPIEPDAKGFEAWKTQWREAATPTNFVLLIVIVTTIGSLVRREIGQAEAAAQIQHAITMSQPAVVGPQEPAKAKAKQ